jgi:protein SCO1/2
VKRGFAIALLVAGLAGLFAFVLIRWIADDNGRLPYSIDIGAPFVLTSHDGTTFDSRTELAGRPYAIFFGFTNCPDICPTTLLDMTNQLSGLGPDGDRLKVLFVSVDPERDTPAHLARYLSSFDPRITGLTGPPGEIRKVAHAFRVRYRKVPSGNDYTMDHTASVFLFDAGGRFTATLDFQEPQAAQRAKLQALFGK